MEEQENSWMQKKYQNPVLEVWVQYRVDPWKTTEAKKFCDTVP
jgi:hypothetical protein